MNNSFFHLAIQSKLAFRDVNVIAQHIPLFIDRNMSVIIINRARVPEDGNFVTFSQYWTTRQTFRRRLGQKEDEYLVASDAELDMKVQVTKSLAANELNEFEMFLELAQAENAFGRFLKREGRADNTQAGKIMASVGRAQSYTAQQRLALRLPLARLYADLEVFTDRAVADCASSVDGTEMARQRYRGSLLWMGDVSRQLDPDIFKQLEQYRKVQAQVRRNKQRLDLCKLKAMQKIDLLVASRYETIALPAGG
ncbi:Arfaptin domain containing protein [Trichuris trichiura]|uniref:Arfaptin domain containing protein n=1 Tax=Trichuris trichiura TaxID=36087 RepID=A0A077Z288_TRITR|nr:Arfaptin domain containing protein [Trichuris trichiura]